MRYHKGDAQQEDRTVSLKLVRSQVYMHSFGVISIGFKGIGMHEILKRRRQLKRARGGTSVSSCVALNSLTGSNPCEVGAQGIAH